MDPFALSMETMRRRRGIKWHYYEEDVLPAWVADMDFAVAEPIQRALRRLVEEMDYGYPHRDGAGALPVAFADRMWERFDWEVDPERVRPVADLVQAILVSVIA